MAFVGLLGLSFLPMMARIGRALWPEQLMLLAAAGWFAFGPSLPGAILAFLGVTARLLLLTRSALRWHSRRAEEAGGSSLQSAG